ncbi:MAG: hypothetical protein COZ37_03585 [bacterium (Candidatus Ratteibacteria) CG_4_10_14_3_um_filter_41_18]|uniref:Inosine/uridine-preferring nucleoside hydrolase domain-containing protein n=4 Tax=Candidatus Ratteibacteria TaxID=2979319 RepID=A0A2M7YEQ8_9BACT|nr:MAG: hypothetical protein AUJ76_03750 [Candidatus Omnitrophica bacterium CG1_02_41_171]PIV64030.1 MAG: hypothetical protein COS11_04305 [bacterium (Candidatus Ratteibacteria) CG01_land_8_20_14_3_00_40_19]PIW33008.1 MAG: hypothetical protein COW28_04800 [bacterium (Candidatus Ratteibacteria) CG15_BIG_FIL_POST_REV_8_21_14_020_41_12]PIW73777.1 MAG: hypothetical protein CO004_04150 [bacterium (Candidatus Ratteibacteria) CG_4_8_14_3_um_filter_41_36]PIX77261.1 MAG: hypothetical protein COZ37_03585
MVQKIILDTDIGDDIDDAYALALVLASPEVELLGITTVFANTCARGRQAQTLLKIAGREEIPVAAGCGAVISPRIIYGEKNLNYKKRPVQSATFWYLNNVRPHQYDSCLPEAELPALYKDHAVKFLIDTLLVGDGKIIPVTIGAMTNLAMALIIEPKIALKIPRIVSMAGAFDRHLSEWNIRCDPIAAAVVFNSGIPMTVVGLDVTTKCIFNQEHLNRLKACNRPIAENLSKATKLWSGKYPVLHDPLAIATIFKPDLVETKNGTVSVELNGNKTYGFTIFKEAEEEKPGPHDICVAVKSKEFLELWLGRVLQL